MSWGIGTFEQGLVAQQAFSHTLFHAALADAPLNPPSPHPGATITRCCRAALLSSVDRVPALKGKLQTGGRLNVARALATLLGQPAPYWPPPQCEWGRCCSATHALMHQTDVNGCRLVAPLLLWTTRGT